MMSAHNITQIADLLGCSKSTISRKLRRNALGRGYRPLQACELSQQRAQPSPNAALVTVWAEGSSQSVVVTAMELRAPPQ